MLLVSAALHSPIGNIPARATKLPHRIYYTRFTHLTRTHCLPPHTGTASQSIPTSLQASVALV